MGHVLQLKPLAPRPSRRGFWHSGDRPGGKASRRAFAMAEPTTISRRSCTRGPADGVSKPASPLRPHPKPTAWRSALSRRCRSGPSRAEILRNFEEVRTAVTTSSKIVYNRHWRLEKLAACHPLKRGSLMPAERPHELQIRVQSMAGGTEKVPPRVRFSHLRESEDLQGSI